MIYLCQITTFCRETANCLSGFSFFFANLNEVSSTDIGPALIKELVSAHFFFKVPLITLVMRRQELYWTSSNFLEKKNVISMNRLYHRKIGEV